MSAEAANAAVAQYSEALVEAYEARVAAKLGLKQYDRPLVGFAGRLWVFRGALGGERKRGAVGRVLAAALNRPVWRSPPTSHTFTPTS